MKKLLLSLIAVVGLSIPSLSATYTTNLNLKKPAHGEDINTWDQAVNGNMDIIDASVAILPVSLSTAVTGTLAPSHLVSTTVYTSKQNVFTDQNDFQTITATSVSITGPFNISNLSPNQCVQTGAGGLITTTGGACGGGGNTALETLFGTARSSPTATLRGQAGQFTGSVTGSTMTFALDPSSVTLQGQNIIKNQATLQSGAQINIASGTVTGPIYVGTMTTVGNATIGGDLRVQGVNGLTVDNLAAGQCVQTTTGGQLTVTGAACGTGSGSGGSSVYPATATASFPYGLSASTITVSSVTVSGQIVLQDGTIITSTSTFGGSSGVVVPSTFTWGSVTGSSLTLTDQSVAVTTPLTVKNMGFAGQYHTGVNFQTFSNNARILKRAYSDAFPQTFSYPLMFEVNGSTVMYINGVASGQGANNVSVGGTSIVSTMTVMGDMSVGSTPAAPPADGLYVQGVIKNNALGASSSVCTDGSKQLTTSGCTGGGSGDNLGNGTGIYGVNTTTGGFSGSVTAVGIVTSTLTVTNDGTEIQGTMTMGGNGDISVDSGNNFVISGTNGAFIQAKDGASLNFYAADGTHSGFIYNPSGALDYLDVQAVDGLSVTGPITSNSSMTVVGAFQSDSALVNGQNVCLQDGTNCPPSTSGSGGITVANQFSLPYYSVSGSSNVLSAFPDAVVSTNTGVSISTITVTSSATVNDLSVRGSTYASYIRMNGAINGFSDAVIEKNLGALTLTAGGGSIIAYSPISATQDVATSALLSGTTIQYSSATFKNMSVTGSALVQGQNVCLQDGTNCPAAGSVAWGSITGTLSDQTDLQSVLSSIGTSTASLRSDLAQVGISTASLQTQINSVAVATGTIQSQVTSIAVSTGVLNTKIDTKINYSSITATQPAFYNSGTGVISVSGVSLSTGVVSILPVANGGTGTSSPGLIAGTNIDSITGTWPNQTINAATQAGGAGDMVLASTQTVSAEKIFTSSRTAVFRPSGNRPVSIGATADSTDGGIMFDLSLSTGNGLVLYNNAAQTVASANSMFTFISTNTSYGGYFMRMFRNDSNSNGEIRVDSPNPNYESCETDQAAGTCYETGINNGLSYWATRNAANDSFERVFEVSPIKAGAYISLKSTGAFRFEDMQGSYIGFKAPDLSASWTHTWWNTPNNTGKLMIQTADGGDRPLAWSNTVGVAGSSITFAGAIKATQAIYTSSSVVGVSRIEWADGSVQVSSPTPQAIYGSKSVVVSTPTTGDSNMVQWQFSKAVTITRVSCSTDHGTTTIQFDERAEATPNTSGTNVMTSSLVCDSDSQVTTSFTNAGIAADVPLNLQITAVSGAPSAVRIHVDYTQD